MRSDIWGLLGISPTADKKAIRSAYAAQSRLHHPEEEPEYFAELNRAYRQALDLARSAGTGDADATRRMVGTGRADEARGMAGAGGAGEGRRMGGTGDAFEAPGRGGGNREDESGIKDREDRKDRKDREGREDREDREDRKGREDREDRSDEGSGRGREDRRSVGDSREGAEENVDEGAGKEVSLLERLAGARQKAIRESMETGALHEFIRLFTDARQVKAADAWKRFFLSETFLGEQYSEEFADGLYAYLMGQDVFPCDNLPMALLQELAIAYALIPHFVGEEYGEGMKYPKEWYKVTVEQTFPARKQVAEVFNRQGWNCDLKSMTRRMLKQPANKVRYNAFSDYLALKEMGRSGRLTEAEKEAWQGVLGFGQVHYLYERNGKRPGAGAYESRSECVVKLYVQWLKEERLPECVLKFLYQKFSFRELDHSSARGLYGALKEQVLKQLPRVEELLFDRDGREQKIAKVYRACSHIISENQSNYEKSVYDETPQVKEQVEALFAMPEWKELQGDRGLFDRLYGTAKRIVMPRSLAEGLIRYLQQGDFPEPRRTELLESLLRSLSTARLCREIDYRFRVAYTAPDRNDLEEDANFWQYYLMRGYGFRHSRIRGTWEDGYLYEVDGECFLPAYIRYLYAPSGAWQRAFTGFDGETESITDPVSEKCTLPDGKVLRVEFHYHYCLYFVEEAPVLSPVLSFAGLRQWAVEHWRAEAHAGRDFFYMLAVTAIEPSERKEAEELIRQWLGRLPLHPHTCPLVARLLAADNDRLSAGTRAVFYEEQERFCFRAVVSGEGIRIYRQVEFGWEDRIFRRAEFGWKEVPLSLEALLREEKSTLTPAGGNREDRKDQKDPEDWKDPEDREDREDPEDQKNLESLAREALHRLRQPKPMLLAAQDLEGMDLLQKARAILTAMGIPEGAEGYCVLRYGQERERRHDRVFYGALSPFGFPIGVHSTEHQRSMDYHVDVARTKIKEGKRYVGRFGWGFKYSLQSDYGPLCVHQGESGTYYADGAVRMCRADSLEELLAECLGRELEGVTEVETYGGLLTVSRLDHRLEYCYGEADLRESVHEPGQAVADYFTVFGGYPLWETFARWLDAALGKGLPDWVNVLTISAVSGNGEGSLLSLTGSYVKGVNPDLPELRKRWTEASGEDEKEEREYPLKAPCLVWGKGLAVQEQRRLLGDVARWYLEERGGEGAKLLKDRGIRTFFNTLDK